MRRRLLFNAIQFFVSSHVSHLTLLLFLIGSSAVFAQNSDIVAKSGYTYPQNIAYGSYQEASNIVVDGNSLEIAAFTLRDGGAGLNDGDALSTVLTGVTFNVPNFANLRRIALYAADGTTELTLTEQAVSGATVTFSGLTITAADNAAIDFKIRASFNTAVTDNQQIAFTITAVTGTGSAFVDGAAGGGTTVLGASDNKVIVTATKLRFIQQPTNTAGGVTMTPSPTVEAADVNNNRDLDFTSSVGVTSTGTMTGSPQTVAFIAGLGTYASIVHTATGTGLQLNTNSGTLTNNASNTFDITASNSSDIIANAGFTYPSNIAYSGMQEAADIVVSGSSAAVAKFDIRDGGATATDADAFPTIVTGFTLNLGTNFGFIRRIALYDAAGTAEIASTEQNVSAQTIAFSGLSLSAPDNGSTSFVVRVSFTTAVTDNQQFTITVTSPTVQAGTSSTFTTFTDPVSSTASDNNRIEVTATKLLFVQNASNTVASVAMSPAPTIEAVDANNRRDLDITSTIGVTSTGTMTGSPQNATFAAGLGTYSSIVHTATGTGLTLTTNSGSLTNITSSAFNITASNSSDIILNSGFTHPTNIAYSNFQAAADIQNSGTSLNVTRFQIRDGGGSADADGFSTVLTDLTLDLGANFGFIRRIALYDAAGTAEIASSEQAVSTQTVSWTGLTITAADGGNQSFTVRVSFTTAVTDNAQFSITVTSATASGTNSSTFGTFTNPVSSTTGDANRIEVTATQTKFVQQPSNTVANNAMSPSPTVEAVDANNKRDLDFATANVAMTSTGTMTATNASFSSGLATYSSIVHTATATGRTLTTNSALTDNASTTFDITSSNSSDISANASFTYPTDIAYATYQEAADLTTSNSVEVARFDVRDGGAGLNDADGLATVLTDITLDFGTNFAFIRRVAIYNGSTEIADGAVTAQTRAFTGLSFSAADNTAATFRVFVSFRTTVTDNQKFSVTINAATAQASTSTFAAANAGGATTDGSGTNLQIEVTATKLLFVQNATDVNVDDVMVPNPTVEATDGNNRRDLDFGGSVDITSEGTLSSSPQTATAVAGLATFTNIVHTAAANNIDLTAASTGLTSIAGVVNFDVIAVSTSSKLNVNGSFSYPANIDYSTYQEANLTGTSLAVAEFFLQDGDGVTNDSDNKATNLTSLTLTITNPAILRKVALYDGTTELNEQVAGSSVTFSGFTATASDNNSKTLIIRASFLSTVTDNTQFSFTVTGVTNSAGSSFAAADGGGAVTSVAGDNNRIEVTATKLLFVQQPTNTSLSVAMNPPPTVEATDANNNRDLDFVSVVGVTSTGTMTGSPQNATFSAGLGTYSSIVHTASATGRTLTTTNSSSLANITSGLFDITSSAASDIAANGAFIYPQNISYQVYQENTDIINDGNSLNVASFTIRDGGSTLTDADALATVLTSLSLDLGSNYTFVRRIALYDAAGTSEIAGTDQAVSAQTVNFTGLSISAADNASASFTVRVSLTNSVIDNQQLSFTVSAATAQVSTSTFATANAGGAVSSTSGDNNRIEVVASKLLFVQQPTNTVVGVAMSPSPSVEAVDGNNIRDLDNTATVSISSTGTLSAGVAATLSSGLGTFSAVTHSAAGTAISLTTSNVAGLTNIASNQFVVIANSSDIISNLSFTYPQNIAYDSYQENADVQNTASSLVVAAFDLRDGGASAPDGDAFGTTLSALTLDLGSNYTFIRRIALYDATGTSEIAATDKAVSTQTVSFTGLSLTAADNGTTSFTVRVSFTTAVVDNQQIQFTVSSATAQTGDNSRFGSANAGGALSSITGDNNRIEILASKLLFVQQPTNTVVNISMSPSPSVEAVDANNKRDLDNASALGLTSTGTLSTSPTVTLAAGFGTYSSVTHSAAASGITLTTTNLSGLANVSSSTFEIIAVSSDIIANAAFIYPSNVAYNTYQENANIQNTGSSLVVAKYDIRDGGATSPDGDGFGTTLTDLTLDLGTNFGYIRRIALYDAAGTSEIASDQAVSGQFITFSGLTLTAADNGTTTFSVRVSFTTAVVDNTQFGFTVTAATAQSGNNSRFAAANAGGATSSSTGDINRIEVTATKLLFVQQPTNTSNGIAMTPNPTVEAVDGNNIRDLDFASIVSVTSSGTLSSSPQTTTFSAGFGTYSNIVHTANATGRQLTATFGGLTSALSSTFDITASSSSDIVNNTGFTYTQNIAYNTYQENVNLQGSNSITIAAFELRDGGALGDSDGAPTVLQNLVLDLGVNYTYIRRIELYDGVGPSEIAGTEQPVSTQLVTFPGLSISASDNNFKRFSVRVSFTTSVVDNNQVSVTINSATAQSGSSNFAASNAGGASSSVAGNDNRIEVTATKLLFVQQPTNTLNGLTMSPSVTVEATDGLNVRDLDFVGTVGLTSTGTMTGSPQNATFASGLGTYAGIVHTVNQTARTLSTTNLAALANATSSTFNITASSSSDIIANTTFIYPQNIAYDTYQESTDIQNSATSLVTGKFDIRDGGSSFNDADGAPTVLTALSLNLGANYTFIRRIALYDASGTTEISGTEQLVGAQTMNFSGLSLSAADNGLISFTVRVSFTTGVVDNQQFSFTISSATPGTTSQFASGNAGGAATSTASNSNRIEVTATQFVFTTAPTASVYADIPFSPAPLVLEARDGLNVKDADYGLSVNITNGGNIPMTDNAGNTSVTTITESFVAGVLTLDDQLRYDHGGNGNGTLTIKDPTPGISFTSSPIAVLVSTSSDIVEGSFSYPDNIQYLNYQAIDINLTSGGDEIKLAQFDLRDGGGASDADGTVTQLSSLTLEINNPSFIERLALYNGATELAELTVGGASQVTFSSFVASAADDNDLALSVYATFTNTITDNAQITFEVVGAVVDGTKSTFSTGTSGAAGGAITTLVNTNDNRLEVIATQIDFTTIPATASINVQFEMIAEARDINGNRDLDFNSTITDFSNSSSFTTANGPVVNTTTFTSGVYAFAYNLITPALGFQFTSGNAATVFTLDAGSITGDSPTISVISSFDSFLYGYFGVQNMPYIDVNNQASDIDYSLGKGYVIQGFVLYDGWWTGAPDLDGAPTLLQDISFGISNPQSIRRIALYKYDNGLSQYVEVAEQAGSNISPSSAYGQITFSNVNVSAPDDQYTYMLVLVTFNNTPSTIADNSIIELSVTGAVNGLGSKFRGTDAPDPTLYIGGYDRALVPSPLAPANTYADGGAIGPASTIEVNATRLDFINDPAEPSPLIAGIYQPLALPVVQARDANQVIDLDYDQSNLDPAYQQATISSAQAGITLNTAPFVQGVVDFTGFQYFSVGDGTLTVNANALSSTTNGSDPCAPVDVVHVYTVPANGPSSNVTQSANLIGNSTGNVIFGVTFQTDYVITDHPQLNAFTIHFGNPIDGVVLNPVLWQSTNAVFDLNDTKIPASELTITQGPGTGSDSLIFTFNPGFERKLDVLPGNKVSFFLQVDIANNVTASTPPITPSLSKLVYTDGDIEVQEGSSYSDISDYLSATPNTHQYSFLDIVAPVIVSSNPANGGIGQRVSGGTISVTFNEKVKSLSNNRMYLYDYDADTLVAVLPVSGPVDGTFTLTFATPDLLNNKLYFIKLPAGDINNNIGIFDESNNAFAGVFTKSVLAFRTATGVAPALYDNTVYTPISTTSGDLKVSMTQRGKVHYLVTDQGLYTAGTITRAIIRNTAINPGGGVFANDSIDIAEAEPYFYAAITAEFTGGNQYDIWTYAENLDQPSPAVSNVLPVVAGNSTPAPFTFTAPAVVSGPVVQTASFNVCSGGFQVVLPNITVVESAANDFAGNDGTMYIVLPSGFEFNDTPGVGDATITRADGTSGTASLTYVNKTIADITFANTVGEIDRLTISGLQVASTDPSAAGEIKRLFGSALAGVFPNDVVGTLSTIQYPPATFTNELSSTFISNDIRAVGLKAINPANGDFGPNLFSGPGITGDSLFVQTVGIGKIEVTLTHTYQNGCVSTSSEIYTIYDKATAIPNLSGQYCTDLTDLHDIPFDGTRAPQYYLQELKVDLPDDVLGGTGFQPLGIEFRDIVKQSLTKTDSIAGNATYKKVDGQYIIVGTSDPDGTTLPFNSTKILRGYSFNPNRFDSLIFYDLFPLKDGGTIGNIEFTAVYLDASKGGEETIIKLTVAINIPPVATFRIQEAGPITGNIYCENFGQQNLNLRANPTPSTGVSTGVYSVNGDIAFPGLTDQNNGTALLNTFQARNDYTPLTLNYTYTSLATGCVSSTSTPIVEVDGVDSTYTEITVTPNPVASYIFSTPPCDGIPVSFDGSASGFQDGVPAGFEIALWRWNFGDATNSTFQNPNNIDDIVSDATHIFTQPTGYLTSLIVVSADGCESQRLQEPVDVGGIPVVKFRFEGVSTADPITFDASGPPGTGSEVSANDTFGQLEWTFGDGTSDIGLNPTLQHIYENPISTQVSLKITSGIGCTASDTMDIAVLPYESLSSGVYLETFETTADWQARSLDNQRKDSVSWEWDTANRLWTTGLDGSYYANEESALYTPAFNFASLERPIISFKNYVKTHVGDGVVLEYSVDNRNIVDPNKVWNRLGSDLSGVDWYNKGDLASNPGNQQTGDYGWSETGKVNEESKWRESKHSLNVVKGEPQVVFRFALASNVGKPSLKGFALDSIRIGNGTRTVLLENFTNTSTNAVREENDYFRNFPVDASGNPLASDGVELVKVEYHVGFPNADPFNEENPADPGARALYYNIASVPQVRLDGYSGTIPGPLFTQWGQPEFDKRVLELANAEIDADVEITEGMISITGTFRPLADISTNTILHVAVVEKNVTIDANAGLGGRIGSGETEFKYVLKKMLPSASGTKYTSLAANEQVSFEYSWTNPKLFMPENDMAVIIFLQEEGGLRRVYQSYMYDQEILDPGILTGVDPEKVLGVFPNPADNEFTIELGTPVRQRTPLQLFDQMGKMVKETWFENGENKKTVSTTNYAAGMYLLQMDSPSGVVRKKIMIMHQH